MNRITVRLSVLMWIYTFKNKLSTVFQDGEWISILETPDSQHRLDDISAIWYRRAYNIGNGLKKK
ncbi:hypothetical protein EJ377_15495 [Chryseobacterium arthrosphaerae]|uniref:MvdD-like pre-ATP grasp domain-containing protein n=1 Tax=Chryseobacterium arthrosphaerae TaxID=651561 RepID=A0A432DSV9_9FLAO|nr:hypothetical protein EJ377_15495 [Chryseobacterium arthrosphaerae]